VDRVVSVIFLAGFIQSLTGFGPALVAMVSMAEPLGICTRPL
jgi:hypothetical protein